MKNFKVKKMASGYKVICPVEGSFKSLNDKIRAVATLNGWSYRKAAEEFKKARGKQARLEELEWIKGSRFAWRVRRADACTAAFKHRWGKIFPEVLGYSTLEE